MKRFWALAIAIAALVVWTVPALAEVKFGGEYRLRAETRDLVDFNDADSSSDNNKYSWYGQRVRLTGVATPTDDVTVKITLQDTRNWGENGEGVAGGPWLSSTFPSSDYWWSGPSLHESFLQINKFFGTPIGLKVGRQELVYGDQRLVGNFGWSNYGRSFDALKVMYASDQFNVDVWTSKLDDNNIGDFGDAGVPVSGSTSDDDVDFHGIYATIKSIPNNTLDLYLLWNRDGAPAGTIQPEITADIKTYGLRLAGKAAGIDYTVEAPFQTGEVDCGAATLCDVDANALAIKLGYAIPGGPMGLKVGAEYDLASGDKDGSVDGDIETFYNLYPTNHDKYGTMDQQGWRNMKAWNVNVSVKPTPKLTARVDYWDFSLDEADGAWYGAGNWNNTPAVGLRAPSAVACGAACTEDELGQEIDITLNYKYNDAVGIMAGASQFFIGDAIEERVAGTDEEDQTWMFVQMTATF